MPFRTNEEKVEAIVEVDPAHDLTPAIQRANNLVTRVLGLAGYDDETMELIERQLAAHFYCIDHPRVTSEGISGLSESVTVSIGQGLKQTTHGQQVLIMDIDGHFAKVQGNYENSRPKRKIGMTWLGTT